MNAYIEYMVRQIAEEIKSIEDPVILAIYLKAILFQRCKIGAAKEGTCKECLYQSYNCRQIYEVAEIEFEVFSDNDEEVN